MQVTSAMRAASSDAGDSTQDSLSEKWGILDFLLLLFVLSCIFDPADKVLGGKVWLFISCWIVTFSSLRSRMATPLPVGLLIYLQLFMTIPVLSIAWYWFTNGSTPFEGFLLLKGYLLIMLAPILVISRVNLMPRLCAVLTGLALMIISVSIANQLDPDLYMTLNQIGLDTGILAVDNRDYGSGIKMLQIYFVTSPMLAISIAYYFSKSQSAVMTGVKWRLLGLVAINAVGMLIAGTRNNILIAILLPIALGVAYTRGRYTGALFGLIVGIVLVVFFTEELRAFFDPTETSNAVKLTLLDGYEKIFSDPVVLVFGQGLGAYQDWEGRGYIFITELTYLELIRNFGLIGAAVMFGLLFFPFSHAVSFNRTPTEKGILIGYAFYLVMCITNPNLFSSMGILILSIILGNIFLPNYNENKEVTLDQNRLNLH